MYTDSYLNQVTGIIICNLYLALYTKQLVVVVVSLSYDHALLKLLISSFHMSHCMYLINTGQLMTSEIRCSGSPTWEDYRGYIQAMGGYIAASSIIFTYIVVIGMLTFNNWWLAYWIEESSNRPVSADLCYLQNIGLSGRSGSRTLKVPGLSPSPCTSAVWKDIKP